MTWEQTSDLYGGMIRGEAYKRWKMGKRETADYEDYLQAASIAAWEYCRSKEESEVKPSYLCVTIRRALYSMAAKEQGLHIPDAAFSKWAKREMPCAVRMIVSMEQDDERLFSSSVFGRESPEDIAAASIFIASLPEDERAVLVASLRTGLRSDKSLMRILEMSPGEIRSAMQRLRNHYVEFFGEGPIGPIGRRETRKGEKK